MENVHVLLKKRVQNSVDNIDLLTYIYNINFTFVQTLNIIFILKKLR